MHRQTLLPPALCVPETEIATGAKSGSPIPLFCARRDTCRSFLDPARVPKGGLEFDFHPSPSIPQLPTKGHEHSVESTSPSYPHPSPSPAPPLHPPIPRKNRRFHSYKQNARPKRHGHLGLRSAPCLGDRSSRVDCWDPSLQSLRSTEICCISNIYNMVDFGSPFDSKGWLCVWKARSSRSHDMCLVAGVQMPVP